MSSVPYSKNLCSVEGVKTKNLNNVIRDKGTIGRQNMAVRLSISSDIFIGILICYTIHPFILEFELFNSNKVILYNLPISGK